MNTFVLVVASAMIATAVVSPLQVARAADAVAAKIREIYLDTQLKEISKKQAMRVLIDGDERVLRCHEVELTEKLTMRKKK